MASAGFFGIGNGVWQIVALVVSLAIMVMGVAGGIEKANKVMMPVLFGLFLVLAIYIGTLPGASEGYKYILTLNPAGLLKPDLWVFAFGQAFFSLSVAGNGSVIYGSYLSKSEDIPSSARTLQYLIPSQLCWQQSLSFRQWQLFWAKASANGNGPAR